ncbi:MAG: HlyD family efflux transporter periplasmic adaptor subunit [FCB group bacterium]|jgi:multidrug resistance efflux pump|nr:HlyD family efflux transporter periplasmic adaptor subunit [FCB group bacterium]
MKRTAIVMALLLAASGLPGCTREAPDSLEVTGQIEGVGVDAGSRIGGRVSEVLVGEGDPVKQGDVLVRLEASEAEAALLAARARQAQAEATLDKLRNGATPEQLRQAEAAVAQARELYRKAQAGARTQEVEAGASLASAAKARLDEARATYNRVQKLYGQNAVSAQQRDQARAAFDAAQAQYNAASEQASLVKEGTREEDIAQAKAALERAQASLDEVKVGARKEDIAAAEAIVNAAKADVARAETALKEMVVVSPRDGVVESLDVHPGDLVKPGPIVRIVDPDDLDLLVYVSAGVLGQLRLGQEVKVTADSTGGEIFKGTVSRVATQGEYTPRNLQTQEERVQQVFGVTIDLTSNGGKLKAGMSATAHFALSPEGSA